MAEQAMNGEREVAGHGLCGAQSRAGRPCRHPAGYGTEHPGIGRCKFHGGSTPNHVKAAQAIMIHEAVRTLGLRPELEGISEHDALRRDLWRTQSQIAWTEDVIARLEEDEVFWSKTMEESGRDQGTGTGQRANDTTVDHAKVRREGRMHVSLAYLSERQTHLLRLASKMIELGLVERDILLRDQQARLFAQLLREFVEDPELARLGLTREQSEGIVARHLRALPD